MRKLWLKISSLGLQEDLTDFQQRSTIFVNQITAVLWVFTVTSIIINFILESYLFIPVLFAALLTFSLSYFCNYLRLYFLAKIIMLISILGLLSYMSLNGGYGSGLEYYFLSTIAVPFIIFREKFIIFFFQLLTIVCLSVQKFYSPPPPINEPIEFKVFYVVNSFYSCICIVLIVLFFRSINRFHEKKLSIKNKVIEEKNQQLIDLNKELEAFSYSASHDLQAPLRGIETFSEILEKKHEKKLDADAIELLQHIRKNVRKMRRLITDLLTLSQSSQKELNFNRIDSEQLVSDILADMHPLITDNNIRIILKDLIEFKGDKSLMFRVFSNLISNAIKYSSKKVSPIIEIGSLVNEEKTVFYVKDNGVGFDIKYLNKIFSAFQRLHDASEFEGSGIGLAIVQRILKRHGGEIWAESKEGEGATFYFSIPKS